MSRLDSLLPAGSGGIIKQLSRQFGVDSEQATSAVTAIVPALAGAMKERLAGGDSSGLTEMIRSGSFSSITDDPTTLAMPHAAQLGQSLLSRLFGSNVPSTLISSVADKSGLGGDVVSRMLPVVASLLGSTLFKSTAAGGNLTDAVGQLADIGHGGILAAIKGLAAKVGLG
jgi:hypothetical protein